MPTLTPDHEAYGKYARLTAVADYVELLALKGQNLSRALLADIIADDNWDLEEPIRRAGADAPENANEASDEAADRVFALIGERMELLGEKYPFEIRHGRLRIKPGTDVLASPYIALLGLTIAHAYKVPSDYLPYQVFEETVAAVVESRGLLTADVGGAGRAAGSFDDALDEVAAKVELRASRAAAPTYENAQDERIDTLCHLSWGDIRPGAWIMIGQVTCAKSESWDKKIQEPSAHNWAKLLGVAPLPLVFLAVPHHVGTPMLEKLVSDRQHVVLDRPRLAKFKNAVSVRERAVLSSVLACDVEGI